MPKFDAYQRDEFNSHYSQTYAQVGDELVYVSGAVDVRKGIAIGTCYAPNGTVKNGDFHFSMDDISPVKLKAGYYDDHNSTDVLCFSRLPITQIRRGVCYRNSAFYLPKLENGDLSIYNTEFNDRRFVSAFFQARSKEKKPYLFPEKSLSLRRSYELTLRPAGFSINMDYACLYKPRQKPLNRDDKNQPEKFVVVGLNGPIGEYSIDNNSIYLYEPVEYLKDGLQDEVSRKFNEPPKIYVR